MGLKEGRPAVWWLPFGPGPVHAAHPPRLPGEGTRWRAGTTTPACPGLLPGPALRGVHHQPHMGHALLGGKDPAWARAPSRPFLRALGGSSLQVTGSRQGFGGESASTRPEDPRRGTRGCLGSGLAPGKPRPRAPPAGRGSQPAGGSYLGDAGVQHGAEEGLAVVGADGRGQEGHQVVLEETLTEKLVEQPAGVEGAQRTLEPGLLDGDVHVGRRRCRDPGLAGSRAGPLGSAVESPGDGPPYICPRQNGSIRGICLESVSSGRRLPGQQKCGSG